MLAKEGIEDGEERLLLRELNSAQEEVTLQTRVDDERTSSGVHSSDIHSALDLLDGELYAIVPMLVVLVLTHEGNGALGVITIESGHVKIINEVDELVFADGAVDLTSSSLKLLLKDGLEEHRVSIVVEVDDLLEVILGLGRQVIEETLSDLGLTATGGTDEQRGVANLNEAIHDVLGGNRVDSGHGEASDGLRRVNGARNVLCRQFVPLLELSVLEVDVVIEDGFGSGEPWCLELFLPPGGEVLTVLATILQIIATTEAPDAAEDEDEGKALDCGVLQDGLEQLTEGHDHGDLDLRDQVLERPLHVLEGLIDVLVEV